MQTTLIIGNKNYSSWSLRAWLLLSEVGIDFEEHRIALDVENTAAELARHSPSRTVPVLKIDAEVIWDTLAIAETIAERWPEKALWPGDALARAHARCVSAEMHSGFPTLREAMPMNCRAMGRKVALPDRLTATVFSKSGQNVNTAMDRRVAGYSANSALRMRCLLRLCCVFGPTG